VTCGNDNAIAQKHKPDIDARSVRASAADRRCKTIRNLPVTVIFFRYCTQQGDHTLPGMREAPYKRPRESDNYNVRY
jgi:hypothetical protein